MQKPDLTPGNDNAARDLKLDRAVWIIAYVFCTAVSILVAWPLVVQIIK